MNLTFVNFSDIESEWAKWETNPEVSPFAYHDYMRFIAEEVKRHELTFNPAIGVVSDDQGRPLMIAPLKRRRLMRLYKMLGDTSGCGSTEFIFNPSLSDDRRRETLDFFFANIDGKMKLRRMREDSFLARYLADRYPIKGKIHCVTTTLPADGTPLKCRRNLNTKYNRLDRDSVSWEVKFIAGPDLTDAEWNEEMELYLSRLFSRYKRHTGLVKWKYRRYYSRVKHDTLSLRRLPNALHALLYFNGTLVAGMDCLVSRNGKLAVMPRMFITADMGFYSPGYILINESLKHFQRDTTIREFDMTRGSETYKLDFRGREYYTVEFKIQ